MADKLADDIIQRLSQLQTARVSIEGDWNKVRDVAAPEAKKFQQLAALGMLKGLDQTTVHNTTKYIFDSTAVNAVERLGSIIEAIICPQSEYWHGLGVVDFARERPSIPEQQWGERLRNLLFKVRYDPDTGFVQAIQTALRRCVAFGNSFIWVDEDTYYRNRALINYRYMPLAESFVAEDHKGIVNTYYRYYSMTAAQAVERFKNKCPARIAQAAENATDKDRHFVFIHCVQPRGDYGLPGYGNKKTPWASFHVFEDDRSIIRESGFYEFPVIDFRWLPEPGMIYADGPTLKALADIQSLQQLAKNELVGADQAVRPPMLVANAGVTNAPDPRPGRFTYGGISPQGRRLVEPLFQGQRLDFATVVLQAKREQVKDAMYLRLFQILVENPQMTATESLIRANEKAELLGPAGARLQQSLSRMIDRELGILSRRGLYDEDSAYVPPRSINSRAKLTAQMTSPIDRLRRAKEGEGIVRLLEFASPMAQIDPTALDRIDPDETISELGHILGVPTKVLRTDEAVAKIRAQRAQQQAAMQNAEIASQLANAGKQGTEALVAAKEAGAL